MPEIPHPPLLSVIVPCYNERATVAELLRRVREVAIDKEIIVIDDKSTDGSRDVVAALAAEWPEIRHVLQPVNMGKGAALRRGIEEARRSTDHHPAALPSPDPPVCPLPLCTNKEMAPPSPHTPA